MLDMVVRNGLLVDGSGSEPSHMDIAVKDDKIALVQECIEQRADREIDAKGKLVIPGFIDIHRHADANVFTGQFGELELRQGITTIVNGNCGLSIAPCPTERRKEIFRFLAPIVGDVEPLESFETFGQYLDAVGRMPLPLNVGCCVGNGTVRMAVKGFTQGKLTKEDIAMVHSYLTDALDSGALGVTLGIVYAPENCYDADDFVEVLEPMRGRGIPLVTHIRGEGDLLHSSLREVIHVAKRLEVPLHISHLKAVGKQNWGHGLRGALEILDQARSDGMNISCDVYPYTAGSSQMIQLLPPSYLEGGVSRIIERLKDQDSRRKLVEILEQPQESFENLLYSAGWESIMVTTVLLEKNQQYIGKRIKEIAELQQKDPYDCAFDLLIEEDCKVAMVAFLMDEKDVLDAIRYPRSSIISDSVYPTGGIPHPRLYAAFPKVLAEYVRDRKELELSQAVQKMTKTPAEVYGIQRKGLLKVVVHPAKNRRYLLAGFPPAFVVVLTGRQPAFVLRLVCQKSCSSSILQFFTGCTSRL